MELREAIRLNKMTGFQWNVVVICIFLTIVDGYEILITAFTLPALIAEWDLSLGQAGLVASIGTLGMGIGAAALSPIADRIGRRRFVLISLTLIIIGMVASGLAPSFTSFLVFRFFAGLFLGGIVPSINVLVAEYASDKRRGTVMGVYATGFSLGAAIGGFISIFMISNFGWQGPFFFSAGATVIALGWVAVALPESVGFLVEKRPKGALGAYNKIAAKLGLPAEEQLPPPTSAELKPSLGRDMWTGIMLRRTVLLWLGFGMLIGAFYFANSFTAKLVAESTGNDDIGIVAQSLVAAGGVIGCLAFALIVTRIHARLATVLLLFFAAVVFFLFASAFTVTSLVLVLAVLVGVGANGGVAAFYAISPTIYPTAIRASAVGLMLGFGRVVAFLAPNIAAFLLAHGFSAPNVYQLYGAVLVLAGVAVWLLHRSYSGDNAYDAMELEGRTMQKLDHVSS